MIVRTFLVLFSVMLLAGCPNSEKKPQKAQGKKPGEEQTKEAGGDAAFQAFLVRLRKAVDNRDVPALSAMMSPDFGYRWDNAPQGETPFAYWDENNLWGELSGLIRERWVPHGGFMVVPPAFAESEDYRGYRAGLTMADGSWRFAYFVSPPPQAP